MDLIRLEAYADYPAIAFSNLWADLAEIMRNFAASALVSGLELNPRKCVDVPLWCLSAFDVAERIAALCPLLVGRRVASSARYLGVELGTRAWMAQWTGLCQRMLRMTANIVSGGESLGNRLRRMQ